MRKLDITGRKYNNNNGHSQANGCFLKVAQFAGTLEDYDRAIDLFERVASKSLDNNLTKWSVREYLFKAMICVLCLKVDSLMIIYLKDPVRSAASLEKYQSMDPAFKGTRECNLCVVYKLFLKDFLIVIGFIENGGRGRWRGFFSCIARFR